MKHAGYRTRAMQASDPRYARIFDSLDGQLAREEPKPQPVRAPQPIAQNNDELSELRGKYQSLVGKRPFMGWDSATLKDKIESYATETSTEPDTIDDATEDDADEE